MDGIGKEMAWQLAQLGATAIVHGRSALRRNGIPMPFFKADMGMSAYGLCRVNL
jgi:NAD(P)-dependent dehydrogenase (short-subunit alcohol dehydrogenase family)